MTRLFKLLAASCSILPTVAAPFSESVATRIITKDVAIIGGGASGAYAAVRLREDYGKSIVLVEKSDHLGGHVDTLNMDPDTGKPVDFGVAVWNDYGPARAFFERMNVTTGDVIRPVLTSRYVDFATGLPTNYTGANFVTEVLPAFQRFYDAALPYEQYLLPGYWNFPAADQIPEELLLPFRHFVEKYNLQPCMNNVFESTGLGVGDMLDVMTIWVLAAFNTPMLRSFLGHANAGSFVPASGRNIEIYEAMARTLGSDVLYKSTVVQSIRSTSNGVVLWVKSATTGKYTLIRAKKLLIAVPPTVDANLSPFDLDTTEKSILSKFEYTYVQGGLVSHDSLPVQTSLVNIPAGAVSTNGTTDWTIFPKTLPFNARFDHIGGASRLWRILTVGKFGYTNAQGQKLIKDNFDAMVAAGTIAPNAGDATVKFTAWSNHGPMHARVTAQELKDGFMQKLYSLEGRRSTWWTGGSFAVNFQAILWAFDDILLPKIVA